MPVLANIYSRSDAFKRKLIDALRNPGDTLRNARDNTADDIKHAGQMLTEASAEGMKYGPATEKLAMAMARAYNPAGITVFHVGAEKVVRPNLNLAGKTSGIPEEAGVFWVTPSKDSARRFGEAASKNPVVSEFDLAPKSQMTVEYPAKSVVDGSFAKLKLEALRKAKETGNDSVLFRQAGANKLLDDEIAVLNAEILRALSGGSR